MAATIIHFGIDQCLHVAVLSAAGYDVEVCGTSLSKLDNRLQQKDFDAVALSWDDSSPTHKAVETARSLGCRPLILFTGDSRTYNPSHFDLVIPSLTPAQEWLERVAELIETSRAIHMQSLSLRQDCAALRKESAELRARSARERARSQRNRQSDHNDSEDR